jgi:hypothetical protein
VYKTSSRFLTALAESHNPISRAQLFLTNGSTQTLDITGGTVTVDRGSKIRRTCSITIEDTSLIPRSAADKLSVYGATLQISRGVTYSDGTQELVPIGYFRVDSVDGDVDDGPVSIEGKA